MSYSVRRPNCVEVRHPSRPVTGR